MKKIHLLFDPAEESFVKKEIVPLLGYHLKELIPYKIANLPAIGENETVAVYIGDDSLKDLCPAFVEKKWLLGMLPHPKLIQARASFGISPNLDDAIKDVLEHQKDFKVDLMYCNGLTVFNAIVVGDVLNLSSTNNIEKTSFWKRCKNLLSNLGKLQSKPFSIKVGDDNVLETAAVGIMAVNHGKSSLLSRLILKSSLLNDGLVDTIIISPRSLFGLLSFLIQSVFSKSKDHKLPPFAGHISSERIKIESPRPFDYFNDGIMISAKALDIIVNKKQLLLIPGRYLDTDTTVPAQREKKRIKALPFGETRDALIKEKLPLINHASTEEFKDLFKVLKENSEPKSSYLVLMILSTILATFGLFGNSSPVVIGAMILAPLMSPIISLSMGVLRQNKNLIIKSSFTVAVGLLLSFLCAVLITLITPLHHVNSEITARIRPNLLDLGIAVVSGVAGAYAHAREEVAKTLAGVAIAVALVPPLAVSGIGMGWGDANIFTGAFLLLMTNLAGIILAAAVTFLFLGFSPFKLAQKGLVFSSILVVLVSLPLALGFNRMVRENRIINSLDDWEVEGLILRDISILKMKPLSLSLQIISETPLSNEELDVLKAKLEHKLNEEVELEITMGLKK
ncbi:MAG: TIGR00341 family protein [Bacteroidota bacterium]|nr:TIGR00341 family protein [Bacteroidota bacterium]